MSFDRFADWAEKWVSKAHFFAFCVITVVVWAPTYFIFGKVDTWQLVINTLTTIITFLLVALLQNTQRRFELSVHEKLDAILESLGRDDEVGVEDDVSS